MHSEADRELHPLTHWFESEILMRRRTKIVATLGPASASPAVIRQLIQAGVGTFRLNMSHGDHASHRAAYTAVRAAARELSEPTAVLADLCGPKLRVGTFTGGAIQIDDGQSVVVTTRAAVGEAGLIPSQYQELAQDVRPNDRILLDDGLLELRVVHASGTEVTCEVIHGGTLKDHKGMNLPGVTVSVPAFTDKDREDARFALNLGVDFLAMSFVRRASDLEELRQLVTASGQAVQIISKIEKADALDAIDEILDASDGIMVARGDMGVELPPEIVPIAQRRLVAGARARNKLAIVATQMLESMIEHPRPTRAEVSDVSTAVFSGADAIMLSAETATGEYPVAAVGMMDRVARQVEGRMFEEGGFGSITAHDVISPPLPLESAIARATAQLSRDLRVRSIVVLTQSGLTAATVAAGRPSAPVVVLSADEGTCRRASLLWGTVPIQVDTSELRHPHTLARRLVSELGLAEHGQYILMVSGFRPSAETAPTVTTLRI
jgi:pyruvate kinase